MENYTGSKKTVCFSGKIVVVNTLDTCAKAVAYLSKQKLLGFDTETRPSFKRGESKKRKVALLQLSDSQYAYLFRLNKIGLPVNLCALLSNPAITKVGVAIHDDIKMLQRLSAFTPASFIDIQKVVENYNIKLKALKTLAEIILNVTISKSQRLTNWECEELTGEQQCYAATDAWICHEIYRKLITTNKIY